MQYLLSWCNLLIGVQPPLINARVNVPRAAASKSLRSKLLLTFCLPDLFTENIFVRFGTRRGRSCQKEPKNNKSFGPKKTRPSEQKKRKKRCFYDICETLFGLNFGERALRAWSSRFMLG